MGSGGYLWGRICKLMGAGILLWIYNYIPFLSLLKVSITLSLLPFTQTISVTYYLLRFYFKHHLPLSPSQFLLNVGSMLGTCWEHLPYLATGNMFQTCWECVWNVFGTLSLFGKLCLSTSQRLPYYIS